METFVDNFCHCNEDIWDYNLLWNTTVPRIPRCFQKTMTILIPSIFLWLFIPLELYFKWWKLRKRVRSSSWNDPLRPIPYNLYNLSRMVAVMVILVVNSVQFGYDLKYFMSPGEYWYRRPVYSDFWYSAVNGFTFALFGFLLHFHRKCGIHTSGLAWVFTFLLFILSLPTLYMYIWFYGNEAVYFGARKSSAALDVPNNDGLIWNPWELVLFSIQFVMQLVLFVLTCFADQRPISNKIQDLMMMNNNNNNHSPLIQNKDHHNRLDLNGKKSSFKFNGIDMVSRKSSSLSKRLSIAPEVPGKECPELRASFLSRLTFWWFNPLALLGYKKSLTLDDLWRLNEEDSTSYIAPRCDRNYISQVVKIPNLSNHYDVNAEFPNLYNLGLRPEQIKKILKKRKNKYPSVVSTLYRTFGLSYWQGSVFKLLHDLIQFISPFLLKIFIDFVAKSDEPIWHGFFLAGIFFAISCAESMFLSYYFHRMYLIGAQIQTALISAIYRKSLQLSNRALRQTTTGEIVNLMSVDAQRFMDLMPYINLLWSAPLRIILLIYFIWRELGVSVFAGVAVMALMVPINWYFTAYQRKLQLKQMIKKDERVKVIGEMLTGMRVIKLYGWEYPFIRKVSCIRDKEIVQLREIAYVNTITSFLWTCAPFLVSFFTFTVYVLSSEENVLDAKKAFVSLSLFNLMQFPLSMLPRTIANVVMMSISVKRLNRFLSSPQLENYITREESTDAITIENGIFSWEPQPQNETETASVSDSASTVNSLPEISNIMIRENSTEKKQCKMATLNRALTLSGINLKIKKGSLVAIVGHVGTGKSSLLSAILGDMERIDGTVNIAKSCTLAYVAQQAWIRNATLKENILFGNVYVQSRYEAIVDMCALKPDIAILPGGDETEIGEKGINLSGGQKQRVSIARACYSGASVILFDDPLSAVDSHVARHIFHRVMANGTGYLRERTRVLVTNSVSFLSEVDQIVVLCDGTIDEIGTYQELMSNDSNFAQYIRDFSEEPMTKRKESLDNNELINRDKAASVDYGANEKHHKDDTGKQLIKSEHTETGEVKASVYVYYFQSLTLFWLIMVLCGYVGIQSSAIGSNVWLAIWSNDNNLDSLPSDDTIIFETDGDTTRNITQADVAQRNYRLAIFGMFGLFQGIFVLFASIAKEKAIVRSSVALHRSLLESIMRSPMKFFDTTPLGRIVNRFSKDIDAVDHKIPHTVHSWLMTFLQVVFTLVLIVVQVPIFLVVVVPIIIMYHFIQKFYVATSRQLKRLESVTRSPIYSHFSETLSGVSTIRAFEATRCFIGESNYRVDTNQRCYYPSFLDNRWLAVRLEFCGNLVVFFTAAFSVMSREAFHQFPGFVGLIITYALSITQTLNWLVRMTSEMETNVVSVERIGEYCEIPTEREWTREVNENPRLPEKWPQKGEIKFVNYSVRFREGLDLVLNGINIEVGAGEKIGIVGRTGSGKSTLTLALFRILEPASGSILIDGVDICQIGLHELRSKLSIIPQDPVLFSGTIRSNLDPFGVYSDEKLWQALEHCHLRQYIASLESGLNYQVAENGTNLSLGQRQLICLGRALLRQTKILVLDEATAAIDLETDALIQQTIRKEFAYCTVLCIAHRLHTILDSSRVLVLDKGNVAEFDSPENLLANSDSKFYALAKDAGLV